jgi:hypothetical protein
MMYIYVMIIRTAIRHFLLEKSIDIIFNGIRRNLLSNANIPLPGQSFSKIINHLDNEVYCDCVLLTNEQFHYEVLHEYNSPETQLIDGVLFVISYTTMSDSAFYTDSSGCEIVYAENIGAYEFIR